MTALLASYFNRASLLSERITEAEGKLNAARNTSFSEIANLTSIDANAIASNGNGKKEQQTLREQQQQLEKLRWDKQHVENTLLVLLGRQTEDENNRKSLNMKELVQKSQQAKVHKVELYLYKLFGDHQAVIDAYLSDSDMKSQIAVMPPKRMFYYLYGILDNNTNNDNNNNNNNNNRFRAANSGDSKPIQGSIGVQDVIRLTLPKLKMLVEIDPVRTAVLVFTLMPTKYGDAIASLEKKGKQSTHTIAIVVLSSSSSSSEYVRKLQELLKQHKIEFDMKHHELYIYLLCQFDKGSVLDYLQENTDKYTILNAQRSCEKGNVLHASAYLQERSGDTKGALDLYVRSIKKCVDELWGIYHKYEALLPENASQMKVYDHTYNNNNNNNNNSK
ncbi:hypothetical protein RFI_23743 [Reticulomyxa filosa]|uniref:Uncharacterized protein n=1 Tax=Reticulomyxa filosa TaxID=46433 RepID=X6MKL4_RETFI|nr:hypothetical protein RFI_23743 [Reticulomyxa filosa]|eukprot:ETO13625.1 hypothetical protein RFI_23743 [Reticulomyxa filosa]